MNEQPAHNATDAGWLEWVWAADCWGCQAERVDAYLEFKKGWPTTPMIVCPFCGNKRCPRASWHYNICTGSNESGQEGSIFSD